VASLIRIERSFLKWINWGTIMKLAKRLLLGSAAGLIALSGARAADLPTKAKSVEYVRICSLYGYGFYYIPGTDTCIKLGGYLRAETVLNTNADSGAADSSLGGARNRLSNDYTSRARQNLQIDTRTATEYGQVRTYFEGAFNWTTSGYSGAGGGSTVYSSLNGAQAPNNANTGSVAGGYLGVWYAFIQFAGFTVGRAQSAFSVPWGQYPSGSFELPGGGAWDQVNQFTYTAELGQGMSVSFSAQDQVVHDTTNIWNVSAATPAGLATGAYGANDIAGTAAPDLIANFHVEQPSYLFQASIAAHDNHAAYYGATETTGNPSDKWGWAGQLALSLNNLPTGTGDSINVSGVYTEGASRYDFQDYLSTTYAMYGGTSLPGVYQSIGLGGLSDTVFVNGGAQQLTKTYGFRGGYNHNWDAHWVSGFYGAWAAVSYNDTAKGYICSAVVAGLSLSSGTAGCNPDFNYAVAGVVTRWTPVKKLTFSADVAYYMFDQRYASGSTVTLPLQTTIAKPAAVYELKNQASLVMLLRAERDF
jgi:Porin subfamily